MAIANALRRIKKKKYKNKMEKEKNNSKEHRV